MGGGGYRVYIACFLESVLGGDVFCFEKDAPDTGNEQDVQERSDRATFAQELLISALFLD
ncbi:hypothetical protein MTR_3g076710 [Medicago truncatula]|uniref:Uncharacterized protein n=1 Tax=Medicago truncatula TaxID=3880 RepID=G7J491_MEDTR|nr:hypothetical protein MTR_3g076710 [Medicago truncatula]